MKQSLVVVFLALLTQVFSDQLVFPREAETEGKPLWAGFIVKPHLPTRWQHWSWLKNPIQTRTFDLRDISKLERFI